MGHKFANIAFTDAVKNIQSEKRSRDNYVRMEQGEDSNYLISALEADFINTRDSFYMASVSETNWPYVQHRGGPEGFMKVIDAQTVGFADFSGNRQYVSTGNFTNNDKVSIIFMDYPNQRRLKLLGRVRVINNDDHNLINQLKHPNYRAKIERGFIIHIEAFDWNCPQHITPRYTDSDVEAIVLARLEATIEARVEAKVEKCIAEYHLSSLTEPSQPDPQPTQSIISFGDGPLALTITGIRQLAPNIRAYELRSATEQALPAVTAGSHLEVPITLADGSQTHRHYSICSNPARRDIYEIAVLNQSASYKEINSSASHTIYQQYQLGTVIHCTPAANYFSTQLNDKQPAILIAGGIGITPIKAIAQSLIDKGHPVHLHYAGSSLGYMAFAARLTSALGDKITLYASDHNQRLNIQQVMQLASQETVYFACGPEKLLLDITNCAARLKISPSLIRLERFSAQPHANDQAISVTLANTAQVIEVGPQQSVLDALLNAGIDANYSCKTGQCKQCAVAVLAGEAEHRDAVLTKIEQQTQFCPCVSRAKTQHLTINI
jgi:ferredoxin-NADP reductase/predicted pyridoxine 5'-phosphate oxidase superfamily flavin-nucleotide-binding protein